MEGIGGKQSQNSTCLDGQPARRDCNLQSKKAHRFSRNECVQLERHLDLKCLSLSGFLLFCRKPRDGAQHRPARDVARPRSHLSRKKRPLQIPKGLVCQYKQQCSCGTSTLQISRLSTGNQSRVKRRVFSSCWKGERSRKLDAPGSEARHRYQSDQI